MVNNIGGQFGGVGVGNAVAGDGQGGVGGNGNGNMSGNGNGNQDDVLNSAGIGIGHGQQGGQTGQKKNDELSVVGRKLKQGLEQEKTTKAIKRLGSEMEQQKVVSLKGEVTQSEMKKRKRVEAMKAGAVKLEGKKTQREIEREKELERLKNKAIKLEQSNKKLAGGDKQGSFDNKKIIGDQVNNLNGAGQENKNGKISGREEEVDSRVNGVKTVQQNQVVEKQKQNGVVGAGLGSKDISKLKQENEGVDAKRKQRMVISPEGKISWEELVEKKNIVNLKQDEATKVKDEVGSGVADNKIVNLKEKFKDGEDGDKGVVGQEEVKKEIFGEGNGIRGRGNINLEQKKVDSGVSGNSESDLKSEQDNWEQEKVDLSALDKEDRLKLQATPALASVHFRMDDDLNGEVAEWFEEYNKLPINIKLGLSDGSVRQAILDLAKKFGLDEEELLGEVARIVRDVYVNLIGEVEIRRRAMDILKISSDRVESFLKGVALIVALVKEVGTEKSSEYFEKLSVDDILEKYPKVAQKEVTGGQIVEKNSGKYVEPTLKNWLDDYISRAGADKHNNLERGKYLTDTPNVKHLDEEDRKKIEMLTKSYDDGIKLVVDPESESVLWQLHTDESALGINSDKEKRVINHFRIDEAQRVDVDNFINQNDPDGQNIGKRDNLSNKQKDSIMKGGGSVEKSKGGVLDLSTEIDVGNGGNNK